MNDQTEPKPVTQTVPFTRDQKWTHGIAFAGLLLNLLGFLVVIITLRGANEPIDRFSYLSMAQWSTDIDKALIQHPELRPYFYSKKPIDPADPNYQRALSVAELIIDTMDSVLEHKKHFPKGTTHVGWDNWISGNFESSPIIREHMEQCRPWLEGSLLLRRWEEWKKQRPEEPILNRPE